MDMFNNLLLTNDENFYTISNNYLNDMDKANINDTEELINNEKELVENPDDRYVLLDDVDNASKNNGMLTKVWGPVLWIGLHCITFGYPFKINKENPEHRHKMSVYYDFFKLLGDVLPCKYCRESYKQFFDELDLRNYLSSREHIVRWLYLIHEKVNDKLQVPSCDRITFNKFTKIYETYRAKCQPDKGEQEDKIKRNEDKGCIKPLDNTPKKSIVNIVSSNKGDVTRNTNAYDNKPSKSDKDDYILINKKQIIYAIFSIMFLLILLAGGIIYFYTKYKQ
jgi:hypothetical protein